jgi:hypothetical protein
MRGYETPAANFEYVELLDMLTQSVLLRVIRHGSSRKIVSGLFLGPS